VGGAIGAVVALIVAGVGLAGDRLFDGDGLVGVGVAGIPVGFIVGRTFLPQVRRGSWGHALLVGAGVGLVAPPLGALEILIASSLVTDARSTGLGGLDPLVFALAFGAYAFAFSFVAVVATIPAGIVWSILARALPDRALAAARMPRLISRLGLRHAAVVIVVALVATAIIRATGT